MVETWSAKVCAENHNARDTFFALTFLITCVQFQMRQDTMGFFLLKMCQSIFNWNQNIRSLQNWPKIMKILARTAKMSGIKTHSYFSPTLHKILKNLCEYVVSIFRDHMYNSIWKVRTFLKPVLTILPSWLTANSFPATWPQIYKQKTDVCLHSLLLLYC